MSRCPRQISGPLLARPPAFSLSALRSDMTGESEKAPVGSHQAGGTSRLLSTPGHLDSQRHCWTIGIPPRGIDPTTTPRFRQRGDGDLGSVVSQPLPTNRERRPNMHAGSSTLVSGCRAMTPAVGSPCRAVCAQPSRRLVVLTAASSGSSSSGLFGSRVFALSMCDPVADTMERCQSARYGPCPIRQGASDSGTSPAPPATENQKGFTDCVRMRLHSNALPLSLSLSGPQRIRTRKLM